MSKSISDCGHSKAAHKTRLTVHKRAQEIKTPEGKTIECMYYLGKLTDGQEYEYAIMIEPKPEDCSDELWVTEDEHAEYAFKHAEVFEVRGIPKYPEVDPGDPENVAKVYNHECAIDSIMDGIEVKIISNH